MANQYVWQNASGNGSGSDWTNARTALPTMAQTTRGDVIYVADGTYSSVAGGYNKAESGGLLIEYRKATASDHGTETGWSAALGDGQAVINGSFFFDTGGWYVNGVSGGGPDGWRSGHGFRVNGTGDSPLFYYRGDTSSGGPVTVEHVECHTFPGDTIATDAFKSIKSNFDIRYCWIVEPGRCPFLFDQSCENIVIEYNAIDSCGFSTVPPPTGPIHAEWVAIIFGVKNVTIRYNLWTDPRSTGGIVLWGRGSDSSYAASNQGIYVYRNIFYQVNNYGLTANHGVCGFQDSNGSPGSQGHFFEDVLFYNNVVYGFTYGGAARILSHGSSNFLNVVAKNNIVVNCSANDTIMNRTHDYNAFFNSGGTYSEANGQALAGSPFVNPSSVDFHLTADTAAGEALGTPYDIDIDGNQAVGAWSRGAYEFQGVAPTERKAFIILG